MTQTLAPITASAIGVDREAKTIFGAIVAEAGEFRSGRGKFQGQPHPPQNTVGFFGVGLFFRLALFDLPAVVNFL